jgi:hypothetical protein
MEQFFSSCCEHEWREIQIEPVTKHYTYKLLEVCRNIATERFFFNNL